MRPATSTTPPSENRPAPDCLAEDSHFQFGRALWPALRRAEGARVVTVSSEGHRRSGIVWDDPNYEHREYDRLAAYGQSKTANNLFAVEGRPPWLGGRHPGFSLHPGSIITPLARHTSAEEMRRLGVVDEFGEPIIDPSRNMKTVQQGAATSVWCATSPRLDGLGGVYCENSDIAPLAQDGNAQPQAPGTVSYGVLPYSLDLESAARLWDLSARLTTA